MAKSSTKKTVTKAKATASAVKLSEPKPKVAAVVSKPITHEAIAKRAKEIWERKGKPVGQDKQNWLEAEAELKAAQAKA